MKLAKDMRVHSFQVNRQVDLEELQATMYEMEHITTGLKLVWLDREEENKTFGIAFKTLPWNDTGVFHILEHSVLCGSDRYPVKEPFVELVKNSLNTFLNAMTFPDKTVYPVASKNKKDFINLVRVYMDAVFHPAIYTNPNIFRQEGWHFAFDEAGKPSYNGVVFNEMKGVMANADELMDDALNIALLPDTTYRYNSGGDPKHIPELTYEDFLDAHRKFYAPSNAYIFLDGSMDIEEMLKLLQEEYLKDFVRTQPVEFPPKQTPVKGESRRVIYEIGEEEKDEPRMRMAWGGVIGDYDDRERLLAMHVLHSVLAHNNHSPLPKCILEANLAEDVIVSITDSVRQPYARIEVRNYDPKNTDRIRRLIFEELERLARTGLDREEVESAMANTEFIMRERDYGTYPQGLIFGFNILESWLYGGKPEANLQVGDIFDRLREKVQQGYFEQLIREVYLENPHFCEVILEPSTTAGKERRQEEENRIQAVAENWSAEERQTYLDQAKELKVWQNSEDTPEALQSLPHLKMEDIQDMPEDLPTELRSLEGTTLLVHDIPTNGVLYVNAFFDISDCSEEELSQISFLTEVLGKLNTGKSTATQLLNRSRLYCGNINFSTTAFTEENDRSRYSAKLVATFSTLPKNLPEAITLVTEILTDTDFSDQEALRKLLQQDRGDMQQDLAMAGHSLGMRRLSAMYTAAGVVNECTDGLTYYQWMKAQEQDWNPDQLCDTLQQKLRQIAVPQRMTLSITGGNEEDWNVLVKAFSTGLEKNRGCGNLVGDSRLKPWGPRREGIVIPADISFAIRGGSICPYGVEWNGELSLAARIISYAYLWNVIRVQGGAYGTGLTAGTSGLVACYSYRDPQGAKSLAAYTTVGDFLKEFMASKPDLTGFIIGAISDSSRVMTPRLKGASGDSLYFSHRTYEDRCRERRRVLNSTVESLSRYAEPLAEAIDNGGIVITGGQNQIDQCEQLDQIITV